MPIRNCDKCGLKVLVDESQASVQPFHCQRCTASEQAASIAPPPTGTVRVQCPYCKSSFSGKTPQKPAKGACPVCKKLLILLPNGEVRQAEGFDVRAWQQEQEAAAAAPPPEPEPELDSGPDPMSLPDPTSEPAPGPGLEDTLLDEPSEQVTPPPEEMPVVPAPEEPAYPDSDSIAAEEAPAEEPPVADYAEEESAAEEEPPPPPARTKGAAGRRMGARGGLRDRTSRAAVAAMPKATGGGMIFLAFLLFILPVGACPALLAMGEKFEEKMKLIGEPLMKGFVEINRKYVEKIPDKPEAMGKVRVKPSDRKVSLSWGTKVGATYVIKRATSPDGPFEVIAPDVKTNEYYDGGLTNDTAYYYQVIAVNEGGTSEPSEVVKAVPFKEKLSDEEKRLGIEEYKAKINDLWMAYRRGELSLRQLKVGATAEQKQFIKQEEEKLQGKLEEVKKLRAELKDKFGVDYDPQNE